MIDATDSSSTRPYLLRAIYEWCTDNGFTPFLAVLVDSSVQVPTEYVKNGEIVLNISYEATSGLKLGNDYIEFKGRFGGVARDILIPVSKVLAIYSRENGQGMAFPMLASSESTQPSGSPQAGNVKSPTLTSVNPKSDGQGDEPPRPPAGSKPSLTRIK